MNNYLAAIIATARKQALTVFTLLFAAGLVACDGGLFGTGDGSDMLEVIEPQDASMGGASEPGAINSADQSESVALISGATIALPAFTDLAFSNTTPTGLAFPNTLVPAVKLINLSDSVIELAVGTAPADTRSAIAQPGTTSSVLTVNTGNTSLTISDRTEGVILATIDSLNAAQDSLTTIIISEAGLDGVTGDVANERSRLQISALDTRAAVSAPSMVELRLVVLPMGGNGTTEPRFRLVPASDNPEGSELTFPVSGGASAYALVNPGLYFIVDATDRLPSRTITLERDSVYTLIVSDSPEFPFFVETNSRLQ